MAEKNASFSWGDFWGMFVAVLLLFGGIPVGLVLVLNLLHLPWLGLVVAGGVAFWMVLVALGVRVTPIDEMHKLKADGELDAELGATMAAFLSLALLFALVCKEMHMSFPRQFMGAGTVELPLGTWVAFTLDNLAECILFDIPNIYDWHLTQIAPISGLSRLVTLVFRISIDALLIASIANIIAFLRSKEATPGATPSVSALAQPAGAHGPGAVE